MAYGTNEDFSTAMTNRSLRTIKAELDFLTDAAIISPQQLSSILSQLPAQTALHAPLAAAVSNAPVNAASPPTAPLSNLSLNAIPPYSEKQQQPDTSYYNSPAASVPAATPGPPPPPAYPSYPSAPPAPPALVQAQALYQYSPTDAGDLALYPNDRISVTEYMNAEWWKGRNERTGQEGIFPRSYVKIEEKGLPVQSQHPNYGNLPLEVSQSGGNGAVVSQNGEVKPNKGAEYGKKFGKKLGNAAVFGAGATIGSNIVNGIF